MVSVPALPVRSISLTLGMTCTILIGIHDCNDEDYQVLRIHLSRVTFCLILLEAEESIHRKQAVDLAPANTNRLSPES